MIRERPKSAMRRSEFSAGVRKSKFSGLRSILALCCGRRVSTSMDDSVVVEVCYCGDGGSDEVCGVGFIVIPLSTYSVE